MDNTTLFGLTSLGIVHTLFSLVAVGAGANALIRDGEIGFKNGIGRIYVTTTMLVCLTGFGIFQHGGFGKPHILGIITIIVLGFAWAAGKQAFGKVSPYIETVGYSMTFFFHIVPGITETATRLPLDAPLAASPEDPGIQKVIGVCFLLFLIGAVLQVRRIKGKLKVGAN